MSDRHRFLIPYSCLLFLSAIWLIKPLSEYLVGDSSFFILVVHKFLGYSEMPLIDLKTGRDIWHPFLYVLCLTAISKIWGVKLLWFRLFGVACLLFNIFLLSKISSKVSERLESGPLMTLLTISFFLLIPYTIDGAVHVDIDNSIILPLVLIFIWVFHHFEQAGNVRERKRYFLLLCFVLALALWAKLTTTLALPLSVAIFHGIRKQYRSAFLYPLLLVLIGGSIFFLSWTAFCLYVDFPILTIFTRILGIFLGLFKTSGDSGFWLFVRQLAIIVFTFNPVILMFWVFILVVNAHDYFRGSQIHDIILFTSILSVIIGITYIFIGGVIYGIPKYHYPMTALISLILSYYCLPFFVSVSMEKINKAILWTALLPILYFLIEDPIYLLNSRLKIQVMNGASLHPLLITLGVVSACYLLPVLVVIWMVMKKRRSLAIYTLVLFITAQTIGFNFRQAFAGYNVSYNYGYSGAREILEYLPKSGRLSFPDGVIISPLGSINAYTLDNSRGKNLAEFIFYIANEKPDAIIFGPALNTLEQMRDIYSNPVFQSIIGQTGYKVFSASDYNIYLKQNNGLTP